MMDTDTPPPHCHFDKSGAAKSHASNDRNTALLCRHFDRSEVEKSHSPMVCSIAEGDLSTQRFNSPEVFIPIPPCPSARDDGGGRQHTVISKGDTNDRNAALPCRHFDRSEVEKSHSPMVCSIATGDLSAQRFNSPRGLYPHTAMSLRSR